MKDLFKFLQLISDFKQVYRNSFVGDKNQSNLRLENDAEHSYELAMAAWYVISTHNLPLDVNMCIRFALVHDLVEVYSGDFDAFQTAASDDLTERKVKSEKRSLAKIKEQTQEFPELYSSIVLYEHKESEEAKFVYSLDKLIANINQELCAKVSYEDFGITFKMLEDQFINKIYRSKHLKPIAKDVFEYFSENSKFSIKANLHDFRTEGSIY